MSAEERRSSGLWLSYPAEDRWFPVYDTAFKTQTSGFRLIIYSITNSDFKSSNQVLHHGRKTALPCSAVGSLECF